MLRCRSLDVTVGAGRAVYAVHAVHVPFRSNAALVSQVVPNQTGKSKIEVEILDDFSNPDLITERINLHTFNVI